MPKSYARNPRLVLRVAGEETFLVPEGVSARDELVYTLNEVAAAIWRHIEPGRDAAAIGRRIAEEFDVDVDKATEDVAAFLSLLAAHGLIREV